MSPMMASANANRPPAPRPWKARKAASDPIDQEKAHSADPIVKMVMAMMKNGLRP